jgi:hypothetical protein
MRTRLLVILVGAATLGQAPARAETYNCAYAPATWNAPKGALVSMRSGGRSPVNRAITTLGEYRTHVMLSHGPGNWVTHAATRVRKYDWNGNDWCELPLYPNDLKYGSPGASQVNQGGIWTYLYLNDDGVVYTGYQNGNGDGTNRGAQIADWAWAAMPYDTVNTPYSYYYGLKHGSHRVHYALGELASYNDMPGSRGHGTVCSEFLYSLQYWSRGQTAPRAPYLCVNGSCTYKPYTTYPNSSSRQALINFRNQIKTNCEDDNGGALISIPLLGCFSTDVCGRAADQVAGCVTDPGTSCTSFGTWADNKNSSTWQIKSLSPDRLGGWAPHPWDFSTWSYDWDTPLVWNSSGAVYGCWVESL